MILAYLTLLTALAISGVAAYYSIIGLVAIFSASVIPIAVMGVVLETGKLFTAAWLYHYWRKVNVLLKTYLISAVLVLMFITSMGIFGFLSKAHIEQTSVSADNTLQESVRWVIIILVWVFDPLAVLLLISANISLKEELRKLRMKRSRKKTTLRKREDKNNKTAWERKLQESKKKDGELTEVTHKNGDVIAKYYE